MRIKNESILRLAFFLFFVVFLFSVGVTQDQTGSIEGIIADGKGTALSGVSVTISSPSLRGPRSLVAAFDGFYRFSDCPLGEYVIRVECPGYDLEERKGIVVTSGSNIRINILLKPKSGSRPQRKVRVAMIKVSSIWGDVQANIKLFEELALPLENEKIDVLITPEGFLDGYMVRDVKKCTLEKLKTRCVSGPEDPLIQRVAKVAIQLNCYVVFGASERNGKTRPLNAAYLIDRSGKHVGTYYKVMPNRFYEPGPTLPVFETDFGKVGIVICADRRWPENIRTLRLKGAEIILNPTWGWYKGLNTAILQTRAYENGIPVCFAHPEQSMICGAKGEIKALLESSQPDVLIHDLNLSENIMPLTNDNKASSHPVQNRRPELWTIINETKKKNKRE